MSISPAPPPSPGQRGFTLIELVVAAGILSILALAIVPVARVTSLRVKEVELRRNLRTVRMAIDRYHDAALGGQIEIKFGTDGWPPDLDTLVEGVDQLNAVDKRLRFLRRIPNDPMTGDREWGLRSSQDSWDATSHGGQNIYDVYSRSSGTALDGSKYSDW